MIRRILTAIALAATLGLAACGNGGPEFSIISGSENTVIEPIVQEFCKQKGATCTMKYAGSLDIGLALQSPQGVSQDAVWPASSVWVDMFDSGRKVRSLTSIAQTPVILGVRMAKARELGWVGKPVLMKDILAAVNAGKLKFLMTSATQSNSGASAYLAMLSSALAGKQPIEPGDLARTDVQATVRQLLAGVERSSGSSGWLADLYVKSAQTGRIYDAMWNYEAVLKETNDRLVADGKEPLYFVYPADGVALADSPLGFVDHGRGADVEKFFGELLAYLQTPDVQKRIAETGRRIPLGGIAAKPEPKWNFDPARLVTAIRMPESGVIRDALTLYQAALRKPSLTALCLDFSGSMEGDGETQLQKAIRFLFTPAEVSRLLVQWTPTDRIIVIPFDDHVRSTLAATGTPADQTRLLNAVAGEHADGGTDMYACADAAMAEIARTPNLATYLPAVVIMTDGRSEGDVAGFYRRWQATEPHVPVFGITFGDADKSQLDTLADKTSARVFNGGTDLAGAFRAVRGYN